MNVIFRKPASWVGAGRDLHASEDETGRALKVRVGVDFGTAFTKVAVRVVDKVYFVNWEGIQGGIRPHLLAGWVSEAANGDLWVGKMPGARVVMTDLKLPMLSPDSSGTQGALPAVGFLAWVLRYTRAWLFRELKHELRSRALVWEMNLGCPTNAWGQSALSSHYKELGEAAWALSQATAIPNLRYAELALGFARDRGEVGLDHLAIVPEFAAQMTGYAKSPKRNEGLHLLVDCGAGTLDVVIFNVHRNAHEHVDQFPIFASAVKPLGTHYLMANRLAAFDSVYHWNDTDLVPSLPELARRLKCPQRELQDRDNDFRDRVAAVVNEVLAVTKARRYPTSPAWREGLPVFLTGGGAVCVVFREAIDRACLGRAVKPVYTEFPQLAGSSRESPLSEEFHRFSVAYGLTFDSETIGKILAERSVEDFTPPIRRERVRPDRDELYAR